MRLAALLLLLPGIAQAEVQGAQLLAPTTRYGHGALTNGEYAILEVETDSGSYQFSFLDGVFEDEAPRLFDLNGDGNPEVITVRSDETVGAMIDIYGELPDGSVAGVLRSPPVGQKYRWYAVAGMGDFDGDGAVEVAFVDRPHLAKTLQIAQVDEVDGTWTWTPEASIANLTNHKIQTPHIEGGVDCDGTLWLANGAWTRIMQVTFNGTEYVATDAGAYDAATLADNSNCE
ncbi:FG-GAP repeat domain-containing protein [Marivivens aquimaris]|uniref:FG-GAP repeat domain-containing protein n=1 Tax=Marivivens aquimaris TaxID=2774876 RepID=UPI0018818877|nr:VCBS repeat-containing protein [Marivivens aquimaris]